MSAIELFKRAGPFADNWCSRYFIVAYDKGWIALSKKFYGDYVDFITSALLNLHKDARRQEMLKSALKN